MTFLIREKKKKTAQNPKGTLWEKNFPTYLPDKCISYLIFALSFSLGLQLDIQLDFAVEGN